MELADNNFAQRFTAQLTRLDAVRFTVNQLALDTNLSAGETFRLVDDVSRKMIQTYPGEHYRWLSAYVISQKPLNILELGTKSGLSLLSIYAGVKSLDDDQYSPKIASVDIMNVLRRRHFIPEELIDSKEVTLVTGDATQPHTYENLGFALSDCDFIFLDTQHTGVQEAQILCTLYEMGLKDDVIILADDINLNPEMRNWWNSIVFPKIELDLHFSGSGLCSFWRELLSTNVQLINSQKKTISVDDLDKQMVVLYFRRKMTQILKRIIPK